MKRFRTILGFSFIISLLVAGSVMGQDAVPSLESGTASIEAAKRAPAPMTPLAQAIAEIRKATVEQVIGFSNRIEVLSPGSSEIMELQSRIWEVKKDGEIAVLQVIIQNARENDDQAQLVEAESALDHIVHPENYKTPTIRVDRPVPSGS